MNNAIAKLPVFTSIFFKPNHISLKTMIFQQSLITSPKIKQNPLSFPKSAPSSSETDGFYRSI